MAFKQKRPCDTSITCSDDLVQSVCDLPSISSLEVSLDAAMKSGIFVGLATVAGGLLFGSRGAAAAGILGSLGTAYVMDKQYKSVVYILMNETTPAQKQEFYERIEKLCSLDNIVSAYIFLVRCQQGDVRLIKELMELILQFLKKNFNAHDYKS